VPLSGVKKLVLGGLAALLLIGAAGSAYYGVFPHKKKTKDGDVQRLFRETATLAKRDPLVHAALALAATYPRVVVIEPFGLAVRVGAGFHCRLDSRMVTQCSAENWGMNWSIAPETAKESNAELVAAAEREVAASGWNRFLGRHTLAGFEGYLVMERGYRSPGRSYLFNGWFRDPKRGRLKLLAHTGTDAAKREILASLEGLAAILTTTSHGRTAGPAPSWPSEEDRDQQGRWLALLRTLQNDGASPREWFVATETAVTKAPNYLPKERPGLDEIIEKRALELGERREPASFPFALKIADRSGDRDKTRAAATLRRLSVLAREGSQRTPAPDWPAIRVRLAQLSTQYGDEGALAALAPELEGTDPLPLPAFRWEPLEPMLGLASRPEGKKLLDAWFQGPLANPAPERLSQLMALTASRAPQMRAHTLAMLGSKARSPLKEHEGLRICDLYARAVSQNRGAPAFDSSAPLATRDRAITAIRAWLSAQPLD
jgi:hypothetical protein